MTQVKDSNPAPATDLVKDCPVPLLQEPWEFNKLYEEYQSFIGDTGNVLEIGSFFGGTLYYWTKGAKRLNKLVSVDLPIGPGDGRFNQMVESKKLWLDWMGNVNDFVLISGDSHSPLIIEDAAKCFPNKDVDFLFIDGDHSYNGVRADFENYSGFVRSGGLVVFHDSIGIPDVRRYVDEIKYRYKYQEIFGCQGGWGITVLTMP